MAKTRGYWHHKMRGINITRLFSRDGLNCMICGEPLNRKIRDELDPKRISFDHIVPRSHGGSSRLDNLRLAHALCNSNRGNDPLIEDSE